MQHSVGGSLRYDRYRTLSWNLDMWFSQAQAVDLLENTIGRAYTANLLRGLVAAYLDLLGDEYPSLCPTHVWERQTAYTGESYVAACEIRSSLQIRESDGGPCKQEGGECRVVIVTWNEPWSSTDRGASICTLVDLLTGRALRDIVLEGSLWRPCVTKLVNAYNFLVDSQCLGSEYCLRIEAQKS